MNEHLGFIAIEGGDGSGKGTQTEILAGYARDTLQRSVMKLSFPQYGSNSAYHAEQYLNGNYGSVDEVHPDLGVLAFAIDRFAASKEIKSHLDQPDGLVLSDRYMASNLAHQGAKIDDEQQRHAFYNRTLHLEYNILNIPRPNLNVVLLMPTMLAQLNVDKKEERSYTTAKRDIHEADANHLEKAKCNYEELCSLYPEEFTAVNCIDTSGVMRTIEAIQDEIRTRAIKVGLTAAAQHSLF